MYRLSQNKCISVINLINKSLESPFHSFPVTIPRLTEGKHHSDVFHHRLVLLISEINANRIM